MIPSHIPAFAKPLPASADSPLLIFAISFLPIIHAGIPNKQPQKTIDAIPITKIIIAFELALSLLLPPYCVFPNGGGGGGGLYPGGGGGGGLYPPEGGGGGGGLYPPEGGGGGL